MNCHFEIADLADLPRIVAMLTDDSLGQSREAGSMNDSYRAAFAAIDHDPNHELWIGRRNREAIACMQLSFLPNLSRNGGWRAQIEGVRVARDYRGDGIGRALIEWGIKRARERNCLLVQLTTDRSRADAVAFYKGLGFVDSHHGMKKELTP